VIVCLCKGVPERAVRRAIRTGARTVSDIGRACGAGTGCGTCHEFLAGALHRASLPAGHGDARPGVVEASRFPALAGAAHPYGGEAP
jgi:bacterioferritin-associated ferredoxin